ncbi:uncharacterized protein LOC134761106 [Pongo abelii]|uniref:uncharacterized protein LOC134761106 n=1 Tax=Pongo abelii TaxID=9601 RepID=UPI0030071107
MVSLRAPSWSPEAPVQETPQAQKTPTLTGPEDSNYPQTLMFCRKRRRKGPEVNGSIGSAQTKPTLTGTEDSNYPQTLMFCRKRKRQGPEVNGSTGSAQTKRTLTETEASNCPQTLFCRKRKRKGQEVNFVRKCPDEAMLTGTEDSNCPQSLMFCGKRKRKGPEVQGRTGSEREIRPEIGRENSRAPAGGLPVAPARGIITRRRVIGLAQRDWLRGTGGFRTQPGRRVLALETGILNVLRSLLVLREQAALGAV